MATSIENTIIELLHARSQAVVNRDLPTLEQLLGENFVYTNTHGVRRDKTAYLAWLESPSIRWESQTLDEIIIHLYDCCAVATCRIHDKAWFGEQYLDHHFATTFVYVQNGGMWHCAAGHTSPIEE